MRVNARRLSAVSHLRHPSSGRVRRIPTSHYANSAVRSGLRAGGYRPLRTSGRRFAPRRRRYR